MLRKTPNPKENVPQGFGGIKPTTSRVKVILRVGTFECDRSRRRALLQRRRIFEFRGANFRRRRRNGGRRHGRGGSRAGSPAFTRQMHTSLSKWFWKPQKWFKLGRQPSVLKTNCVTYDAWPINLLCQLPPGFLYHLSILIHYYCIQQEKLT